MDLLHAISPSLEHFRALSYALVLAVSLLESLAFVGLFVPGTVFIVLSGLLAAQGVLDVGDVIVSATIGAILGDLVSFYLGRQSHRLFGPDRRVFKPQHLEKTEKFVQKYGSKSIWIGRFVGPLRPVVPFVAGLSKMDPKKFLLWNVVSGIAWALVHVLTGYFFGEALGPIERWTNRIGYVLVTALAMLALFFWVKKLAKIFTQRYR